MIMTASPIVTPALAVFIILLVIFLVIIPILILKHKKKRKKLDTKTKQEKQDVSREKEDVEVIQQEETGVQEKKILEKEEIDEKVIETEEKPFTLDPDSVFAELTEIAVSLDDIQNKLSRYEHIRKIKTGKSPEETYKIIRNHIKHTHRLIDTRETKKAFAICSYAAKSIKDGKRAIINISILKSGELSLSVSGESEDLNARIVNGIEKLFSKEEKQLAEEIDNLIKQVSDNAKELKEG